MAAQFFTLSKDMQSLIFSYLQLKDYCNIRLACKQFACLVDERFVILRPPLLAFREDSFLDKVKHDLENTKEELYDKCGHNLLEHKKLLQCITLESPNLKISQKEFEVGATPDFILRFCTVPIYLPNKTLQKIQEL